MKYSLVGENILKRGGLDSRPGISGWRKRHRNFIRCVSFLLAAIFLHQQIGWAENGQPVWVHAKPIELPLHHQFHEKELEIPYDLARATESALGADETIIHIQDAHASLSAQYSITNLLDSLVSNYDLEFIAVEGSSGYIDTSVLRSCPNKDIRKNVATFLMEEGYMSAGEFFEITSDEDNICLYGVEDDALYAKNVESFRQIQSARAAQTGYLVNLLEQFSFLTEKIYSKNLHELNKNHTMHRDGSLSFSDYWAFLEVFIKKHNIDLTNSREIIKLLEAVNLEGTIDFTKANDERRKLIDDLSKNMGKKELESLVLESLAFKQNKVSQTKYYEYLTSLAQKKGIRTELYKNLIAFARYITIYESVRLFELYREVESIEGKIREALYRNADEKALYEMNAFAALLMKLYSAELNTAEFKRVKDSHQNFDPEKYSKFIKEKCAKYAVMITSGYDLSELRRGIKGAMDFYIDAEKRNAAMLRNTLSKMRAEGKKVAALITGGYHTEGLTTLMKQKQLSYLVVEPKFEDGKERPYIAILTNKKKPYEKLLESGRYKLAVAQFCYDNNLEELTMSFDRAIKTARETNEDVNLLKENWCSQYEKSQKSKTPLRKTETKNEPISLKEFEKVLEEVIAKRKGHKSVEDRLASIEKSQIEISPFDNDVTISKIISELNTNKAAKISEILDSLENGKYGGRFGVKTVREIL